jgi:peroxiredoxin
VIPKAAAAESPGIAPPRASLPRFEGRRIDGGSAGTDLFQRRRGIVYVFASTDRDADLIAGIVKNLEAASRDSNIAVLGVNRDFDPDRGERFVRKHGLEFPVVLDVGLAISRKLRVPPGESTVLVIDAEGSVVGGFAGLEGDFPEPAQVYERQLRSILRLEGAESLGEGLGLLPEAPEFRVVSLEGSSLTLSSLRGNVVVLILFSPTCPHCHAALRFLQKLSDDISNPEISIVPVSVLDRRYVVEDMLEQQELRFTAYLDPDLALQNAYAHQYTIPDILVITREGRVVARHKGYSDRIQALLTMEVRRALGIEGLLLLDKNGYSGEEACRICHQQQHETWSLTTHAYAFETLVEHGEDRNPECLPCHTVGWDQDGGYSLESPVDYLAGVQCENCHGRGGSHQSPKIPPDGYEPICQTCHTEKHSLNFAFADRIPMVSHAANAEHTGLSSDERRAMIEKRDRRERALFQKARYVGSASCQSCHVPQYEIWAGSGHARAFDTLREKREDASVDCQRCHTTGFGEAGGFPEGGDGLVQVGCESCHGPGEAHVKDDPPKPKTILALADKCDSCVVLQICGSCHDDANDPGFEFELLDKIAEIRHGMVTVGGTAE